jgi:hypothetical protein
MHISQSYTEFFLSCQIKNVLGKLYKINKRCKLNHLGVRHQQKKDPTTLHSHHSFQPEWDLQTWVNVVVPEDSILKVSKLTVATADRL